MIDGSRRHEDGSDSEGGEVYEILMARYRKVMELSVFFCQNMLLYRVIHSFSFS